MRLALCLLVTLTAQAASSAQDIMARVALNQDRAEQLRTRYVYRQTTAIRVRDSHGQLTREEITNYEIFPAPEGTGRKEVSFAGKYRDGNRLLPYTKSGEPMADGFRNEADAHMSHNLRDGLTASKTGRDGISPKLFPLTSREQAHYTFQLKGEETAKGIPVFRIEFKPKKGEQGPDTPWAGEALISRTDFEPVQVATKLGQGIPFLVRTALGTNLHGLGFAVTYSKFEDGVWFPVSYGAEFDVRAVFVYNRRISVSLSNTAFKRAAAESSITFSQ